MTQYTKPPYRIMYEFNVMAGSDIRIVAACGGHSSNRDSDRVHAENIGNTRLVKASIESYATHFGPRAVEAAEADRLGEALDIIRTLNESTDIRTLPLGLHVRIDNILATLPPKGTT